MNNKEKERLEDAIKFFKKARIDRDMACILPEQTLSRDIIKWLEKLKDYEEDNKWILVDKKLPDPDTYILVSFENFAVPMIGRYTVDDNDSGTFRIGDEYDNFIDNGLFVNAWMPLPESYKEK